MAFYPYLFFGGNCREAFTRYHQIFGGELVLLPMSDAPADASADPVPADQRDLIMHAALTIDGQLLMASDEPTGSFEPPHGMSVNYSAADVAETERVFAALAEGGQVTMPLAATFFSPSFGMCVDRFGTPWMISADAPADAS